MNSKLATDEVTDSIAHIEMHRQEAEKEGGLAAACSEALRKLHELLANERQSLQHSPEAAHSPNIEAVTIEIERVKRLAGHASQRPGSRDPRPGKHQPSPRSAPRNSSRGKGRRTMGRNGGR